MRLSAAALLGLAALGCGGKANAPPPPVAKVATLRPQPKPGERVRQPELDSYCAEPARSLAFYYHGGRPVIALAHKDGCAPLFISDCEAQGHCYPPRDQEPGMWCCSPSSSKSLASAHASATREP